MKKWPLWSLEIQNAFRQADGFDREVYLRAPCESNSKDTRRVRELRAPAYGLNDALVASHSSLRQYSVNSVSSPSSVGLRFDVSSFGPRVFFIFRKSGKAVGEIATHIADMLGRGEPGLLLKARDFSGKCPGELEAQEGSSVHVGMELAQEKDFSAKLTQEDFT